MRFLNRIKFVKDNKKRFFNYHLHFTKAELFKTNILKWSDGDIYVDFIEGSDANDGFSKNRPIKTHLKLFDTIKNLLTQGVRNITVSFKPGWYRIKGDSVNGDCCWLGIPYVNQKYNITFEFNDSILEFISGVPVRLFGCPDKGSNVSYTLAPDVTVQNAIFSYATESTIRGGSYFSAGYKVDLYPSTHHGWYDDNTLTYHVKNVKCFEHGDAFYLNSSQDIVEVEDFEIYSTGEYEGNYWYKVFYVNRCKYVKILNTMYYSCPDLYRNAQPINAHLAIKVPYMTYEEFRQKFKSWYDKFKTYKLFKMATSYEN